MGESSWGPGARVGSVLHSSLNGPKCRKLGHGGRGGRAPIELFNLE